MPIRLPDSLDDAEPRRRSPLMRAAVFVPAVAAGILVVAIAAAVLRSPSTGVGSGSQPPASGSASTPAFGACRPDDVVMAAEPWGGAAGSRGTVVTVSLAGERDSCGLNSGFSVQIADDSGKVLAEDNKDTFAGGVHLTKSNRYMIGIAWSNWCDTQPQTPIHLYVTFPAEWNAAKEVPVPDNGIDPVPPCLGSSQATSLSVTDLQKAQ